MQNAHSTIEAWRIGYNTERPHSSLGDLAPEEFRNAHASAEEIKSVSVKPQHPRILNPGLHLDSAPNRGARQTHLNRWSMDAPASFQRRSGISVDQTYDDP